MSPTISVIGLGYIGLPTAAVIASRKIRVHGVDINQHAVNMINSGKIHIIEPDLDLLVSSVVQHGYLTAHLQAQYADYFLIAVPTPFQDDGQPDLRFVRAAAESIAPLLRPGNTIVLESTSPVGATHQMVEWLAQWRNDLRFPREGSQDHDVFVAYCPERVLPGKVIQELVQNDRVIGGITPACSQKAKEVYSIFVQGELVETNAKVAEMCKLSENAYRDVNIAFANELSMMADTFGVNVWELIELANRHPRVNILKPGCGVGGHCIAVDPWFLVAGAPESAKLIRQARLVNDHKPEWVIAKIDGAISALETVEGRAPRIAVFGLAFKPDIDDLRESPALEIARSLYARYGANVTLVEPYLQDKVLDFEKAVFSTADEAVASCDILVLLVAHRPFTTITWNELDDKSVLDFCGLTEN